ncbi:DUF3592 domain-containing protein [Zooshikella marina]|uniref:DUF3592 domain-containing protein n=1 Tax=Zooshikella ganghwensis TaxID=202772 RepID=UPI001BAE8D30|nr:DUF3592 domain-containing protein [Zooshikella ganghwensis]MBU2706473.1 DUF3592 domain-containing protein [Zooshikella ganghwensis]
MQKLIMIPAYIFAAISLVLTYFWLSSVMSGKSDLAYVKNFKADYESKNVTVHYAVIEFDLPDGKEIQTITNHTVEPKNYDIGYPVRIRYNPDDPSDVQIDSFFGKGDLVIILWIFALVWYGLGFVVRKVFSFAEDEKFKS